MDVSVTSPCTLSATSSRASERFAPCCGLSGSRPRPGDPTKTSHPQSIPGEQPSAKASRSPSSALPCRRFRFRWRFRFSVSWRRRLPRNALALPLLACPWCNGLWGGTGTRRHARHANQVRQKQIAQISQIARLAGRSTEQAHRQAAATWASIVGEGNGDGMGCCLPGCPEVVVGQSKRGHGATGKGA